MAIVGGYLQGGVVYEAPPKTIRIIGVRSFIERIASIDNEILKNIRSSQDESVQFVMDGLKYYSRYVDLDHPITLRDLNTLVTSGLITAEHVTTLLVDGTIEEAYNGTL